MSSDLLSIHANTLQLRGGVSCEQLGSRAIDLMHHLGYGEAGIQKGSQAARFMSMEAKQCNGKIRPVERGGLCASMQSIGTSCTVKRKPGKNLRRGILGMGVLLEDENLIEDGQDDAATGGPRLANDYLAGGYNCRMAEEMLNKSILPFCTLNKTPCCLGLSSSFKVVKMQRLENIAVFQRHVRYEAAIAKRMGSKTLKTRLPNTPEWLKKLGAKNGLSEAANSVYLLHGTHESKLEQIVQDGLKAKYSLSRSPRYGKGLYFADNACKASQYSGDGKRGVLLICRVVLGKSEVLPGACRAKLFPCPGYNSAMAKAKKTQAPAGLSQLHNEYIIFDERACYPEFVVRYRLS